MFAKLRKNLSASCEFFFTVEQDGVACYSHPILCVLRRTVPTRSPSYVRRWAARPSYSRGPLPALAARRLPDGSIDTVEEVGRGDHEDQSRESPLVVLPGGLVPDRVWDRIGPVGKSGDGLSECESGTFRVAKVWGLPPGRYGEEALFCFTCLPGAASAIVHAEATAIDLTRTQMDKLKYRLRHAALSCGLEYGLYTSGSFGKDRCRVAHSLLHYCSPSGAFTEKKHLFHFKMSNLFLFTLHASLSEAHTGDERVQANVTPLWLFSVLLWTYNKEEGERQAMDKAMQKKDQAEASEPSHILPFSLAYRMSDSDKEGE